MCERCKRPIDDHSFGNCPADGVRLMDKPDRRGLPGPFVAKD